MRRGNAIVNIHRINYVYNHQREEVKKIKSREVIAVGSSALDTIETPHGRVEDAVGGSVFYIGAAGGLFAPIYIVAVVGDDFPMDKIEFLRDRDVNLDGLEVVNGSTFRWEGFYHKNMNQRDTISTDLGVFEGFSPVLPKSASKAEYLLLANIDPMLQLRVLEQVKSPRLVAFDTMNHWIEGSRQEVEKLLKRVDLILLNDEELCLLTDEDSPIIGARKLLETGPKYIVVKKGEHGAVLIGQDGSPFLCPAFPLAKPVDPTGAGDTFAGAMLGYLAATDDLGPFNMRRAVVYGTVAASFTVEDFGISGLEKLDIEKLQERYRQFQTMVEF